MTKKNDKIKFNYEERDLYTEQDLNDGSGLKKQKNKKRIKNNRHQSKDLLRDIRNGNIDYESYEEWSEFQ